MRQGNLRVPNKAIQDKKRGMPPHFEPLPWVRWLGLWMALAAFLGRGLQPALQGIAPDGVMRVLEGFTGILSQGLLIVLSFALIRLTSVMLRMSSLPVLYRILVTALGGVVLGLVVPSGVTRLAPVFHVVLAVAVSFAALAGAAQALFFRSTRILGVLLALTAMGALTRQVSLLLMLLGGAGNWRNLLLASVWVAGAALSIQGGLVTVGLLWLSTRKARWVGWITPLSLLLATGIAWYAEQAASFSSVSWRLVVARVANQYLSMPVLSAPTGVQVFLAVAALFLGGLAVVHQREAPAVVGAFSLLLVAGLDLDVPLCALGVTVAALIATLAAHDPETSRYAVRYDLAQE